MGRDLVYCSLCDIYSKDMKNHIVVIVINYPFNLEAVECERILFC